MNRLLVAIALCFVAAEASACDQAFSAFRGQCLQGYSAPLAFSGGCSQPFVAYPQAVVAQPFYGHAFVAQPFVVQRFNVHHGQAFRAQRFRRQPFNQEVVSQNGTVSQRCLFNVAS